MADPISCLSSHLPRFSASLLALIELFGVRPLCASGEAVSCEVILANEIGWEVFQGGETFWGIFL